MGPRDSQKTKLKAHIFWYLPKFCQLNFARVSRRTRSVSINSEPRHSLGGVDRWGAAHIPGPSRHTVDTWRSAKNRGKPKGNPFATSRSRSRTLRISHVLDEALSKAPNPFRDAVLGDAILGFFQSHGESNLCVA